MSIVVLKRKTQHQYGKISHDVGFSLNGTARNLGYIGRDLTGRHLLRSLARGTALKGHGGSSGTFLVKTYISSDINTVELQNTIKPSSLSHTGRIATSFRWIRRPFPYATTKEVTGNHFTQSEALKRLKECVLAKENKNKPKVKEYRVTRCRNLSTLKTEEPCSFVYPDDPEYKKFKSYELYNERLVETCVSENAPTRTNTLTGLPLNVCSGRNGVV